MSESILVKRQIRTYGPVPISGYGKGAKITAKVRYDDECGNGHNTFAITGEVRVPGERDIAAGGCLHTEIAKAFPELAPVIKWHLVSSDGPMHYIPNTVYHADSHGPTHAHVYYSGPSNPLGLGDGREALLGYLKADAARAAEGQDGYRVAWDERTAKVARLDYARSSAVWPDATDEELTAPDLEDRLAARLPALLAEFRAAIESLGFTY